MPPSRHKIGKVSKRGEEFDFSNKDYEIDDNLQAYSCGELLRTNASNQVSLYTTGGQIAFGLIRLYMAVVFAIHPDIEKCSGIRVVNYDLPLNDGRRYGWETPSDREKLRDTLKKKIMAEEDSWKTVMYDGVSFDTYEIHNKTSKIRHKKTKIELYSKTSNGQVGLWSTGGKYAMVRVYRAYMYTFVTERREDQRDVDHINGDSSDHSPWNLRWASRSENCMYKFKQMAKQMRGVPFTGKIEEHDLIPFEDCLFGYVDGKYSVLNGTQAGGYMIRHVGDFRVDSGKPYPSMMVKSQQYQVHRLVAYIHGIITRGQLMDPSSDAIIMHLDDDKENFDPRNLKLGTQSENQKARHDNPTTTLRKRVLRTDAYGNTTEYESQVAAAEAIGVDPGNLGKAIIHGQEYKKCRWQNII